jgi:hypothetical protein
MVEPTPFRSNAPRDRRIKCLGIGRDKDDGCSLNFFFDRPVSNDEMRFLHEVVQRAILEERQGQK